jgi:hypothetical protein
MMHAKHLSVMPEALLLCLLAPLSGCSEVAVPVHDEASPTPQLASQFDPALACTISGRVSWEGSLPSIPQLETVPNQLAGEILKKKQIRSNPNTPVIGKDRAIANAVVFLRGIDPKKSKPWDLPPVEVVQQNAEFHVRQGATDSHIGFVRLGDHVEMVSRDRYFYSLHADGAAFFTLTFPDPDQPLKRSLNEKGLIELTSAAGYFWMRGYLFVDDHPYYARTDPTGRFQLPQVPPGRYEVVCWLPNWNKARHERDPENGNVFRLFFQPPIEQKKDVTLTPKQSCEVSFVLRLIPR